MDINAIRTPFPMPPLPGAPKIPLEGGPGPKETQLGMPDIPLMHEIGTDTDTDTDRSDAPKPEKARFRIELAVDQDTHQVFGRVIDTETGRAVRELPAKELRHMAAQIKEMLGPVVNEVA